MTPHQICNSTFYLNSKLYISAGASVIEISLSIIYQLLIKAASQDILEHWSLQIFMQIIQTIMLLFSHLNTELKNEEDIKLLLLKCLSVLFTNTLIQDKAALELLLTPNLVAYILSTLLELCSSVEKSRTLRILSINTMKQICLHFSNRKTVAIFLPGIVSSLTKVK